MQDSSILQDKDLSIFVLMLHAKYVVVHFPKMQLIVLHVELLLSGIREITNHSRLVLSGLIL